jgi:PIN domain nuclease of toxin-antitoxin system
VIGAVMAARRALPAQGDGAPLAWRLRGLPVCASTEVELEHWLAVASSPATVDLARVTPAVAAEVARLPSGFHRDPADRLIVATARVRKLRVLTRDRMITQARVVPLWRAG